MCCDFGDLYKKYDSRLQKPPRNAEETRMQSCESECYYFTTDTPLVTQHTLNERFNKISRRLEFSKFLRLKKIILSFNASF